MLKYLVFFALALGCSSGDDFAACTVNQTQACACPGGTMGAQACGADGAWGKCQCAASGGEAGKGVGGGAGTSVAGTGGDAGAATEKECEVDADCSELSKPICQDWTCQDLVPLGGECRSKYGPGGATAPCVAGTICKDENGNEIGDHSVGVGTCQSHQ